ncbi:MAG: LysM peptidoglycan-binding domain-containing protein [Patescibacteria group bacterium]
MRQQTIALSSLLLLVVLCIGSVPAHAIESFGIGALPAHPRADSPRTKSIFVYEVAPLSKVEDAIKVINNSDKTKILSVYPVDSQDSSDGAFACAQAVDRRSGVGNWIQLAKDQVTLQPYTNETIAFTLNVPANADVGEHNGCIAIQDLTTKQTNERGIVLSFRSALRVAVTVPGKIEAELRLVAIKSRNLNRKTLQISPVLKNSGNVSLDTDLSVALTDIFGRAHSSAKGQLPVLTKSQAQFNFEVTKPFWGGWYKRVVKATYKPLTQTGAGNKKHLKAPTVWLFVPPQPLAIGFEIAGVVIVALCLAYWLWRQRRQRIIEMTKKHYRIREGDNIQSIAEKFGQDWKRLAKLNRLKAPYILRPGEILTIPQPHLKGKVKKKLTAER